MKRKLTADKLLHRIPAQPPVQFAKDCAHDGIAIFMTPESRCSLLLKRQELDGQVSQAAICRALDELASLPWRDVIDESDDVLKPKFQLVYAVGDRRRLSALDMRCAVLRCVLRALQFDERVRIILDRPCIAVRLPPSSPEAFMSELRLLPSDELNAARSDLVCALIDAVLHPAAGSPSEADMSWLHDLRHVLGGTTTLREFITNTGVDATSILARERCGEGAHYDALLALRGLLGFGMLEHCLTKRHRADYGFAPELGRKRIAVPFRAADTPALRAEFAHPDVALVLTTLAGLHSRLSIDQVSHGATRVVNHVL